MGERNPIHAQQQLSLNGETVNKCRYHVIFYNDLHNGLRNLTIWLSVLTRAEPIFHSFNPNLR
jgi:hypothetical protein